MAFTIVGGGGFVGSALARQLRMAGHDPRVVGRGEVLDDHLGHVVYCAGLTGTWSERPLDAVESHVCALNTLVRSTRFESLVYLSSTRVYDRHPGSSVTEDDELVLDPREPDDLYALSKATGEAVTIQAGGRVARLSNVYGPGVTGRAFLADVITQARLGGPVVIRSSLDSSRDFVDIRDVSWLLMHIALAGCDPVYNVASGDNVTNQRLMKLVTTLTGAECSVLPGSPRVSRPHIDVGRARTEFGYSPRQLEEGLPDFVNPSTDGRHS